MKQSNHIKSNKKKEQTGKKHVRDSILCPRECPRRQLSSPPWSILVVAIPWSELQAIVQSRRTLLFGLFFLCDWAAEGLLLPKFAALWFVPDCAQNLSWAGDRARQDEKLARKKLWILKFESIRYYFLTQISFSHRLLPTSPFVACSIV